MAKWQSFEGLLVLHLERGIVEQRALELLLLLLYLSELQLEASVVDFERSEGLHSNC